MLLLINKGLANKLRVNIMESDYILEYNKTMNQAEK